MKKIASFLIIALAICLLPLAHTDNKSNGDAIAGFTVTKVTNSSAKVKTPDGKYQKLEAGKFYSFPATIKSERAQVFIEFSIENTAKLLPRTTLALTSPTVRHPKLRLLTGSISLELDKFPKDHKMEITTPTAVCGAVGTHFEVSYSGESKQQGAALADPRHSQSFKCSKGEVYVQSDSFKIGNVKAGLEVLAETHKGKENSYSKVVLNTGTSGNTFKINMSGADKELLANKDTSFELAHTIDKELTVVKFENDAFETDGFFSNSKIDVTPGKSFVKVGDKYIEDENTDAYLLAAKKEGQLDTQVREIDEQLLIADENEKANLEQQKQQLATQRDSAATAATAIAKRFRQNQNIRRTIDKVRQNIQRNRIRR